MRVTTVTEKSANLPRAVTNSPICVLRHPARLKPTRLEYIVDGVRLRAELEGLLA